MFNIISLVNIFIQQFLDDKLQCKIIVFYIFVALTILYLKLKLLQTAVRCLVILCKYNTIYILFLLEKFYQQTLFVVFLYAKKYLK